MRLPFVFNQNEDNYRATTKNFQWLIQQAIDNGQTLRALGNGWSFSEVAICKGGLVDTRELRTFFKLEDSFIAPEYFASGKTAKDLVFTQCGMSILQMHKELESENGWLRSMRASGASNGQTVVGATQTGTHGSGMSAGAVHDAIRGLHVITGPDKHVWIERASQPVASDEFITWLGATPVRDDNAFNAAVVSFGSFGFIHGVLLETEPIYLLKKFVRGPLPYTEAVKNAINHWDFSGIEAQFPFPLNTSGKELDLTQREFRQYFFGQHPANLEISFIYHEQDLAGFCTSAAYPRKAKGRKVVILRSAFGLLDSYKTGKFPLHGQFYKYMRYKLRHFFTPVFVAGFMANPLMYAMICKYTLTAYPRRNKPAP